MKTNVYVNKDGEKYLVFHRNSSDKAWEHPYDERETCLACRGESEAAPKED